jgi:hypothetical protein
MPYEIGDFVSWNSSGGKARGKIERIERDGTINIPDSEFIVTGTDDDPAALIRVFKKRDDGYEPSETLVGHKFSTLTKIDDLPKPSAKRNQMFVDSIDMAIAILMQAKASYDADEMDDEMEDEPDEIVEDSEYRAINLSAPAFMRASAKRGLALHEQGLSGDGLVPQTVEDARKMAAGEITEAKWRKIGAWIARHIDDLDAVQGSEITAGLVAMLLWGGGSSKASARRAQEYANRIVERLDSE